MAPHPFPPVDMEPAPRPGSWLGRCSWPRKILYTINNVSREGNRSRGEGDGRTATEQGRAIAQADRDMGMSGRYGPGGLSSGTDSWPKRGLLFVWHRSYNEA